MGFVLAPTVQSSSIAMVLSGGTAAVSRGRLSSERHLSTMSRGRGAAQKTYAALHFAPSRSRRRLRRRSGTSGSDSGSSGDEDDWFNALGGGADGNGGNGSSGGGSGGSGWGMSSWDAGSYGDAGHRWLSQLQRQWEQIIYESGWVWMAFASLSMVQATHFVFCLLTSK